MPRNFKLFQNIVIITIFVMIKIYAYWFERCYREDAASRMLMLMNEWMNEWINESINQSINERMNEIASISSAFENRLRAGLSGVYTIAHVRRTCTPNRCTAYMYDSVNIHRTCTPYMYAVHLWAWPHTALATPIFHGCHGGQTGNVSCCINYNNPTSTSTSWS